MKILFVSPYLPHPLSGHGGGAYLYEMLCRFSKRHTVTLISFADAKEMKLASSLRTLPMDVQLVPRTKWTHTGYREAAALTAMRLYQLIRSVLLWEPYYVSKFRHRGMARAVLEATSKTEFDVVQIEYSQMGQYVQYVHRGKTIIHFIDVTFRPAYRYYKEAKSFLAQALLFIEFCRWMYYEPRLARRFDAVTTLTESDQMLLKRFSALPHVETLPPGVDVPVRTRTETTRDPFSLLFVGNLAQKPNSDAAVWLCSEIFPKVKESCPEGTLLVIGRAPPPSLLAIAERTAGIEVLGFVEDLSEYFLRCSVFIAPLRLGGGVKIKLLQALAYGIPVVTTPIGVEGISGLNSSNVKVARKAADLVLHAVELLRNPTGAEEMGRLGQKVVREKYSWDSVIQRSVELYQHIH